MAGLLDIAPLTESVPVRGVTIVVTGVSATGVGYLLGKFPELRKLMTGKKLGVEELMAAAGVAVPAIIAAGIGFPGDTEQEAAASRLDIDAQADLLAPILRLTLPNGVGPFVRKLSALGSTLGGAEASGTAPVTKSRRRSPN